MGNLAKSLFEKIILRLSQEHYFIDFNYRKKDCSFVKKTNEGYDLVGLQNWESYDRGEVALTIVPRYAKRYNILHKWFEKISVKTLSDQRNVSSIGFDGSMLNKKNQFFFLLSEKDFEKDFLNFRNEIIENSSFVSEKYSNLSSVYKDLIDVVICGKKELPNVGADWIFQYLMLTKQVCPENYHVVKSLLLDHIEERNSFGEPNICKYYPKIDEIFYHFESLEI